MPDSTPASVPSPFAGRRVLVVEDSATQRAHLAGLIAELGGAAPLEAANGLEALAQLEREPLVDLILTDLEMPVMDGVAFIGEMASRGYRPELVIVSSQEQNILRSVRLMAVTFGLSVAGFVQKPIFREDLEKVLSGPPFLTRSAPAPAAQCAIGLDEIRTGLRDGEFLCFFQPQLTFQGAHLKGVEALIRWRHPQSGLLGPGAFLPQAETDPELMSGLTLHVLEFVARQWQGWNTRGLKLEVAVNLSAQSLSEPAFADRILEKVSDLDMPPRFLVFEMTESASVSNLGHTLSNLNRLRMKGFGLSIDDFGTGFATFEQLERIPFTELKVDQSITRGLPGSERHTILARNMLQMAKDLHLTSVAEGIETQEMWDALKALGCDRGQGYFLGRPMPGAQLKDWVLAGRSHLK